MKNTFNRLVRLQKDKQLSRTIAYKFLHYTKTGQFFSFSTQGLRLKLFSSEMTYEAWKSPIDYRISDLMFLKRVLKPGDFVVDVGANIGMISMHSAKLVGDAGRVIAIEPNPNIFPFCNSNIRFNRLKNVKTIQTALGDRDGEIFFNCEKCDDCSRVDENGTDGKSVRVPITTLDAVTKAEGGSKINLLKIDVEGYELIVLAGATESLKRTDWIYIEVEGRNYSHYGKRPEEVLKMLNSQGFDTFASDDAGNWTPVNGVVSRAMNLIGKKRPGSGSLTAPF